MPRLTFVQLERAIGMLQSGIQHVRVALQFGVHPVTISHLRMRFHETGSTADRPRPGQPRVTTPAVDRHIPLIHLRDGFRPSTRTAVETPGLRNPRISDQTVRNTHQILTMSFAFLIDLTSCAYWSRRDLCMFPILQYFIASMINLFHDTK